MQLEVCLRNVSRASLRSLSDPGVLIGVKLINSCFIQLKAVATQDLSLPLHDKFLIMDILLGTGTADLPKVTPTKLRWVLCFRGLNRPEVG